MTTEAPKMMMVSGLNYNYVMAEDYFKKSWDEAKNDAPFNQLPLLIVLKILKFGKVIQ